MKLRKTRVSRIRQVRRATRLWFVCLRKVARARQDRPGDALAKKTRFYVFHHTRTYTRARPAAPSRGTRRKQITNTHNAPLTLLSDRACVACPLVRAPPLGGERESSAARREERRERQRTRADREPRQRKADFPWRPRTPRAPRRAPLASRARSFCARLARRRSRGAERTE